jgi:hypothetical protein
VRGGVHLADEGQRDGSTGKRGQAFAVGCGVGWIRARWKREDGPRAPIHKSPVFGLAEVVANPFEGQIVDC